MSTPRELFRHTLATLAYRAGKVLRDAPDTFGASTAGGSNRTPSQILAHMADLLDWALSKAQGVERWVEVPPGSWASDTGRFFAALEKFDAYLASDAPVACSLEELFQGPVADALTHVGQLAMLRRLAGCPMKGENYARADIVTGRVGLQQSTPARES
jgi:hypothetical protein